jgi:hypothetical protein
MASPAISTLVYALKGIFVVTGFLYIFIFRKKVIFPVLGLLGFGISIFLNAITVNKFVIDIWVLYLLSFLFYNLHKAEQERVLRYSGWMYLLTPFLLAAGTLTGIIRSDMWISEDGLQISFGLTNPNYFMFFFLYAIFCWVLLRKKMLLIITFTAAGLFYYITETRSVLYGGMYIIILFFFFRLLERFRLQLVFRLTAWTITGLINLLLVLMLSGYYDLLETIAYSDTNLRSRMIDILETIDFLKSNPGIALFGGFEANLDNMYLNFIAALGVIHFIFLWVLIQASLVRNIIANRPDRFILISCMMLIGFIEHGMYSTILPSVLLFTFFTESGKVVFKGFKRNIPALLAN